MAKKTHDAAALYRHDAEFLADASLLCGVDEAGRGPLCGPVAVAAVILNYDVPALGDLDDSKNLTEPQREALYAQITVQALAWQVSLVGPEDIDRMNILQATLLGMQQAVQSLAVAPHLVLVDGNSAPELPYPCKTVVKGDALSACIAAASILAKVTRDRFMLQLDRQYPQYRLAQHKGYGTKLHYQLLAEYGIQSFYRKSFLKNWKPG